MRIAKEAVVVGVLVLRKVVVIWVVVVVERIRYDAVANLYKHRKGLR